MAVHPPPEGNDRQRLGRGEREGWRAGRGCSAVLWRRFTEGMGELLFQAAAQSGFPDIAGKDSQPLRCRRLAPARRNPGNGHISGPAL